MRLTLTVTEGPHQSRRSRSRNTIPSSSAGRSRAHFRLSMKDKYFSRNHFLIEVNPPHCRLMDLGSRNGTFLNGARVTAADLHDGSVIKAGPTVIQVSIQKAEVASPLPETVVQPTPARRSSAADGPMPSTIDLPARGADTASPPVAIPRAPAPPKTPPPLMPTVIGQAASGPAAPAR